jgi:DNA polymerase III alpha subunit
MAIASIEDLSGKLELVFFPKMYTNFSDCLDGEWFLTVEGEVTNRNGDWQMTVSACKKEKLEDVRLKAQQFRMLKKTDNFKNNIQKQEDIISESFESKINNQIKHEKQEEKNALNEKINKKWDIFLQPNISSERLIKLKSTLKKSNGDIEIIFFFKGQEVNVGHSVTKTDDLVKSVNKILEDS